MKDTRPHAPLAQHFGDDSSDRELAMLSRRRDPSSMQMDSLIAPDDLIAALRASELRLSSFLEERSRLVRDLHDIVLQSLYAIGLRVETRRRRRPDQTQELRRSGDLVVDQLNQLIHQIRGIIRGLESGTVEEFDLTTELETLARTYMEISPILIEMQIAPDVLMHLTREEKQELINITREAVSNCVRHAKATRLTLALTRQGARVRLLIRDNGVGFTSFETRSDGYGLVNMNARARRLGGTCSVRSRPGCGTEVVVEFALFPELVTS